MRYVGFSEMLHDASLSILDEKGNIIHSSHSERYSKFKNDPFISPAQVKLVNQDDIVTFYEDHQIRKNVKTLKNNHFWKKRENLKPSLQFSDFTDHHLAHACNGYYTAPWDDMSDVVMVTIDGEGEWTSYRMYDSKFNILEEWSSPKSVGMWYTRVTKDLGLRPLEDEFVVMGLASYGQPIYGEYLLKKFYNLPDKSTDSISDVFPKEIYRDRKNNDRDVAASIQYLCEKVMMDIALRARKVGSKLILTGGVAQNIVAASQIRPLFDDMWIPVAPHDAGSSLGAAAWRLNKDTGIKKINWKDPYLGFDLKRDINPKKVVDHIIEHKVCGVANGPAEFGARALGNRSLLADVRYDVKDTVNEIKHRQKYRPFAPAILSEHADEYFDGYMNEYMQYRCMAKHDYKSVTHVDGSARVQLVHSDCKSVIRQILEEYYQRTGVPMLLNTSLNIRGKPMVNDENDARLFEMRYGVKVF